MTSQQKAASAVVIGLDCSTTGAKAIAFDRHGKVLAQAVAAIPLIPQNRITTNKTPSIGGIQRERY